MLPGVYDMELYRGDTVRRQFKLWQDAGQTVPVDLTGATAAAQIRERRDSVDVISALATTITLPNTVQVELSTVTMAAADQALYVNAATLAALTIRLPPTPAVGLPVELCFAASITALTVRDSAGGAITGAPVSAYGPGAAVMMRYVSAGIGWVYWK